MKTLGDLVVSPLNVAIQADVNDAAPEPGPDHKEGPNNEEAAQESPGTIPDAKAPENE